MMYEKILVTGATGFLGGRVVEGLRHDGATVVATGRNIAQRPLLEALGASFVAADLSDQTAVSNLVAGCDLIVHCAARSSPWGTYGAFWRDNVEATDNLLAAARQHGVKRFVFVSTPSIYFDFTDRRDIKESDPLPAKMVNHYAATKLEAEKRVFASGLPAIALRPRAIIGRGDTVIMPRVLHAYQQNRLRVIGSGQNTVSVTPVANVVHAIKRCMDVGKPALGRAYNISGEDVPLWDMLRTVLTLLGHDPALRAIPYSVALPIARLMETYAQWVSGREPVLTAYSVGILAKDMTLNTDLARQVLDWQPVQRVEDAVREFAEWWIARAKK